jgi:hypothetical protein
MAQGTGMANLEKIDHIVVLMLEKSPRRPAS